MIWDIISPACRLRRMSGCVHGGGVCCIRARGGRGAGAEAGGSARRAGHQALSGRMATGVPPHSLRRQLVYICLCADIDTVQKRDAASILSPAALSV